MFKMVLNLHSFYPILKEYTDYVLFRTKDYKLRSKFPVNCFFETEFRGHVNLYDQAREQLKYAQDGDILIAPDKLFQKDATIERIEKWLEFLQNREFDGKKLKTLMPIQGTTPQELQECYEHYKDHFHPDLYGLSVYCCLEAFHKRFHIVAAKNFIDDNKIEPLHALGWSFTTKNYKPIFERCYSMDSQSAFPILAKSQYYIDPHLRRIASGGKKLDLHERTRLTFKHSIEYWKKELNQNGVFDTLC